MTPFPEARWWTAHDDGAAACRLCPRGCVIQKGAAGYCGVRVNEGGILRSAAYGRPTALQIDPIEKKPLCEFLPGARAYSIGTFGCNLGCKFCQNHHISKDVPESDGLAAVKYVQPSRLVANAIDTGCETIAFTYNEPTVWAEFAIDLARMAKTAGIATVLVSNGYISAEAADELYPLIDAANIDMKGFSDEFYSEMCHGSLQPVLDSIEKLHGLGSHVEITNLIIPGRNDSDEMIHAFLDWVASKLNKNIPLHFSAYRPMYKYNESPPTPPKLLHSIGDIAAARGFTSIHLGNIGFWV